MSNTQTFNPGDDADEARDIREALEYIIDCAAREAWEAAREGVGA